MDSSGMCYSRRTPPSERESTGSPKLPADKSSWLSKHSSPTAGGSKADHSRIPPAPAVPFEATFERFVEEQLDPLLPSERAIRMFHHELMRYVTEVDALFITRVVRGQERRNIVRTRDRTRLLPSDNSPAWWWHMKMFHGFAVSRDNFAEFVSTTPTRFHDVAKYSTVSAAGWHVAHILDAKDGNVDWRSWTRADAARRFVRNVHPLNLFYVPKADVPRAEWTRVGGDPELLGYVASVYATRWPDLWAEFASVAGTPVLRPDAGDRILHIDGGAGQRPRQHTQPADADQHGATSPWDFVLGARRPKPLAVILGRHPDAEPRRRSLVEGLTLERFVALGNALYNKTRKSELEELAPDDPVRQADLAFDRLEEWMTRRSDEWIAKQYRVPSGWTGAIALLREGSDDGLAMVCRLDLAGLVTAALRIVDGPYRTACSQPGGPPDDSRSPLGRTDTHERAPDRARRRNSAEEVGRNRFGRTAEG